jgi:photosystem II stability/assembly factor-like uncharacterized protein
MKTVGSPRNWRVGPRGLIQTLDPQGNWVTLKSGVATDLYDIAFSSSSYGWAVGQGGTVLRTTDAGTTWLKVPIPTTEDLVGISAANDLTATTLTRSKQIFVTRDGGKSWMPARKPE